MAGERFNKCHAGNVHRLTAIFPQRYVYNGCEICALAFISFQLGSLDNINNNNVELRIPFIAKSKNKTTQTFRHRWQNSRNMMGIMVVRAYTVIPPRIHLKLMFALRIHHIFTFGMMYKSNGKNPNVK